MAIVVDNTIPDWDASVGPSASFNIANGDLLVAIIGINDTANPGTTPSNSGTNLGWAQRASTPSLHPDVSIWTAAVSGAQTGITVSVASAFATPWPAKVLKVTGQHSSPIGNSATGELFATGDVTLTTTGPDSVIFAAINDGGAAGVPTFAAADGSDGTDYGANLSFGVAYKAYATAGAKTWTVTLAGTPDAPWAALEILVAPTAPAAPTIIAQGGGHTRAGVEWTAGYDGGSAVTSWDIDYATAAAPTTWLGPSNTGSTNLYGAVTGLTNGTAYVFRVRAVNAVGNGTWSATSSSATPSDVRGSFLLESTDKFLLESGDEWLLESGSAAGGTPGMQYWGVRMR